MIAIVFNPWESKFSLLLCTFVFFCTLAAYFACVNDCNYDLHHGQFQILECKRIQKVSTPGLNTLHNAPQPNQITWYHLYYLLPTNQPTVAQIRQ